MKVLQQSPTRGFLLAAVALFAAMGVAGAADPYRKPGNLNMVAVGISEIKGQTPIPPELTDPVERRNFLNWRHEFWVTFSRKAAASYRNWLENSEPAMSLAETPPPYPSKT